MKDPQELMVPTSLMSPQVNGLHKSIIHTSQWSSKVNCPGRLLSQEGNGHHKLWSPQVNGPQKSVSIVCRSRWSPRVVGPHKSNGPHKSKVPSSHLPLEVNVSRCPDLHYKLASCSITLPCCVFFFSEVVIMLQIYKLIAISSTQLQ